MKFETSLGPIAQREGAFWVLDLTSLELFHGLSVLAQALGEQLLDEISEISSKTEIQRTVKRRENPELRDKLGVTRVAIKADQEIFARISKDMERFQDNLRTLFGTLQREKFRNALFPRNPKTPSTALVLTSDYRMILEQVISTKNSAEIHLRITIKRLADKNICSGPMLDIETPDLLERTFIAGSTRIAQTWREGIRSEVERGGRRSFVEFKKAYSHTFAKFAKAGLAEVEHVNLAWDYEFGLRILQSNPDELDHLFKKVLLALEDRGIRDHLEKGETIKIVNQDAAVYLDRSHLGRALNISLGQPRNRVGLDLFLHQMPVLSKAVARTDKGVFQDFKVFLIHHITSEVLGLISALRDRGCKDLVTLFVAYAARVPFSFLDALLALPSDEFRCLALSHVSEKKSVEGYYRLSPQYSEVDTQKHLVQALSRSSPKFFEAMQAVALVEFLRLVSRAEKEKKRCLIIEDGGYLAPALNQACLEGKTIQDLLSPIEPGCKDKRKLYDVLGDFLVGSVEHTRNGMNRLTEVEEKFGKLAFPAFSIAVSEVKTKVEAQEVAVTILNAVENFLHATGKLLSRRNCLVIGSKGAIGYQLMGALESRLKEPKNQLSGIDLLASASPRESRSYRELPQNVRKQTDLVIGVTGTSVLKGKDLEEWVLGGESPEIIFASGSTKTEEFTDVALWIDGLLNSSHPKIGCHDAGIDQQEVTDPQTGKFFGRRYKLTVRGPSGEKIRNIVFLANLTPVNFMYYGVPTEVIDEVLSQLFSSSTGLIRRASLKGLTAKLYAVDRDITENGDPLGKVREA